jgi:hypothetical protein
MEYIIHSQNLEFIFSEVCIIKMYDRQLYKRLINYFEGVHIPIGFLISDGWDDITGLVEVTLGKQFDEEDKDMVEWAKEVIEMIGKRGCEYIIIKQ